MLRSVFCPSRRATLRFVGSVLVFTLGVGSGMAGALEPRDVVVGAERATYSASASGSSTETPVMGAATLNAAQLAAWYRSKGYTPKLPALDNNIARLAQVFLDEGATDGVRGDIAFVQSAVETGYFTFPDFGQIRPSFNNYAGINAFGGRAKGTTCAAETSPSRCFATPQLGARTQIHLLRGYADPGVPRTGRLKNPPADRIGVAPLWEDFGYCPPGKLIWAGTCGYGDTIVRIYRGALQFNGVSPDCLAVASRAGGSQGRGYWLAAANGEVRNFGAAPDRGSLSSPDPVVDGRTARQARGYYLVTSTGRVGGFGTAPHYGDVRNRNLSDVVGMDRTSKGFGYWIATAQGRVFEFGAAPHYGSLPKIGVSRSDVVGIERSGGNGYWLYTADGTVYPFGDAQSFGSLGAADAAAGPVVSLARTPSGDGYWILQRNGNVRAFGDATQYGELEGCVASVVSLLPADDGKGYWVLTGSGRVVPFGSAKRIGEPTSLGATPVALIRF